ncbi:AraC family transcriptional regulator [Elizabethkingia anophelis]|uniref:helix-turn-helix domain-containing protein n=1 Tax=Weeksellaceae TaxID=2762318 RepID=UPI000CE99E86|nr:MULTISPECIES: helix-turn-helix transcriptional regulator [Weeksellaceae]AVF49534.1 AraC family transcriptional regulator [Elizabethkingia anophelis]AVF50156.1 AraC family transcriptional regulator [Elizabethkingia anophelis]MDV4035686.1 AraC family transcriptional regulator [Elizabethkingia anophelis]
MKDSIIVKNKIESDELIKVSPFRKEIRKTLPHKHGNYFEIIYLREGKGTHTIDYAQYPIETPTIFFVRREQVHHWNIESLPEGYVLLLKKGFLEKSVDNELKNLLSKLSSISCLYLHESDKIETFFQLLISENDFTVTEGILKALLAKIISIAHPFSASKDKKSSIIMQFRELLNNSDDLKNNVAYYAEKLNTTPQNLNTISRKTFNLSASEIIAEHIICEAKRLLLYTGCNVSEVAYHLNFNDTSHFAKYFKRHTGVTPQTFRKEQ